jgi:hypothetical protein
MYGRQPGFTSDRLISWPRRRSAKLPTISAPHVGRSPRVVARESIGDGPHPWGHPAFIVSMRRGILAPSSSAVSVRSTHVPTVDGLNAQEAWRRRW